jgi:hypothetical protein
MYMKASSCILTVSRQYLTISGAGIAHSVQRLGYDPRDRGVGGSIPSRGKETLLFSITSRPAPGSTQLPTEWVPRALSPGAKLTTHHLVLKLSTVELQLHSPYVFMARCLIKLRDNFTFYLRHDESVSIRNPTAEAYHSPQG